MDGDGLMKFMNRDTGVILEPSTLEAEEALKRDPRYTEVLAGKSPGRTGGRKPKLPETED